MRRLLFRKVHKNLGGRLDTIFCGGAALSVEVQEKWEALGIHIVQGYGLTETSPIVTTNTLKDTKIGSVGKVIPGVEVTFGEGGEILVSGPNVFAGYYKDQERTKEVFDEQGRFKTGDIGHVDEDGFLFISGRKKYVIVSGSGQNVYPEDIEEVLKAQPGVIDAAVIGLKRNGQEVVHACLLGTFKEAHVVIEQANKQLSSFQRIIDWSVWPEADFPRSATRKVKKEEVRKWLETREEKAGPSAQEVIKVTPLVRVLSSVTGKDMATIADDTKLMADLHLDSLMRIELVSRIEETFDSVIEEHAIVAGTTVKDLEKLIAKGKQERTKHTFKSWLLSWPMQIIRSGIQRLIVFPIYRLYVKVEVEGLEHLSNVTLPAIFMPNHITYADGPVLLRALPGKIRRRIAFAAALDLIYQHYWYVSSLMEIFFNSYPFPRREEDTIKPGLETTGKILDAGFSILIFPEGRVSESGELLPLKRGAGFLATEMDVPIVPVIISGLQELVPPWKVMPRKRGTVTVRFGKPLSFGPGQSYIDVTKQIEDALRKLSKRES